MSSDGSGFYIAQNVGRAKVQGIEGSWAGHVGATDVRATFTFQNPVDETNHEDLTRRARRFRVVYSAPVDWRLARGRRVDRERRAQRL